MKDMCDTKQQRFDRAIYLHYVENELYKEFKPVSEDVFIEKICFSDKFQKMDRVHSDLSNIYRLSDDREIYKDRFENVLGEVWIEFDISKEEYVKSYWINEEIIK